MSEAAGPANQDGIFYQNTVAAGFLAELLNLNRAPPRENVVEVRVEAVEHVDDIVVTYADRHREFIQAKSNLRATGDAWTGLWTDFAAQAADPRFRSDDRLILSLGARGNLADSLRAMADRSTAPTEAEWETRCGKGAERILAAVRAALPTGVSAFALFRLIDVRVSTHEDLAADFRRLADPRRGGSAAGGRGVRARGRPGADPDPDLARGGAPLCWKAGGGRR